MQTLLQDLKHAVRGWQKHPGYLLTALLTLALGIGFTTATFTVVDAVLLRPLPYDNPDRLVRLIERNLPRFPTFSVSPGHYMFWRDHATAFEGIGAWATQHVNMETGAGDPQRVRADRVTVNLFPLLGVRPVAGRGFEPADETGERAAVALLSYGAWQRHFGGEHDAVGRVIRMDGHPVTIVGVMPERVRIPSRETEIWVPFIVSAAERASFGSHFMGAVARLKPGITLDAAAADMGRVSARLIEHHPESRGWEVLLFDLHDHTVEGVRQSLLVLFGAVSLVLLIACVNVANLLLARGAGRHRELAIRSSIGASRVRLLRQLLIEQLMLAGVGSGAGVLLAAWLLRVLLVLVPDALPVAAEIVLDGRVLGFALALAVGTPLLFGLLPAVRASRPDIRTLLSSGGRHGGAAPAPAARTALVVAEIALAMALLVGAGLFLRSFANLTDQPPGFTPAGAVLAGVSLPPERYPAGDSRERFFGEFLDRIAALPAVRAAGLSMPMAMVTEFNSQYWLEGTPAPPEGPPLTLFYAVSSGYFEAMGIPLVAGRYLSADDRRGGHRVVVINEALANTHFQGRSPLGQRIRVAQGDTAWREIVGVVGNVKQEGLDERPRAQVYESYLQHPYFAGFSLVVRSRAGDPVAVVPDVRNLLRSMDPELPLARVRTLEEIVGESVRAQRFSTTLIAVFGAAALVLAAVGVYGLIAYTVGLRRQEFAIRVAHGAGPADILRLVLNGAARMSVAGIAIGFAGAWLLGGLLQGLLFDISVRDPLTYLVVAFVLVASAFTASIVPALRAARVDPAEALRGN